MAIAAIGSIGGAFQAASAFLGLRAERGELPGFLLDPELVEVLQAEPGSTVLDPAFAPGFPYFEAVAAALEEAGYLDA